MGVDGKLLELVGNRPKLYDHPSPGLYNRIHESSVIDVYARQLALIDVYFAAETA